jgi:organic hydroperoxide reductase OsmC/OhrA
LLGTGVSVCGDSASTEGYPSPEASSAAPQTRCGARRRRLEREFVQLKDQGMAEYLASVSWQRGGQDFLDGRYSRGHVRKFDGGAEIPASPSPHVVPAPMSVDEYVDPEETFVTSLSSCHLQFFFQLACKARFVVDNYLDEAVGIMAKNEVGTVTMTKVTNIRSNRSV